MATKVAIMASANGSNAENIVQSSRQEGNFEVRCIVTDRHKAHVRQRAARLGVPCAVVPFAESKQRHEEDILRILRGHQVEWVFLAGYMRIIGPTMLAAFDSRILNIHPSLLPAFPGLHAYRRAFEAGVSSSGVTVHFVDEGIDTGKIVCQQSFPRLPGDTLARFTRRGMELEHRLYPLAIRKVLL